MKKRILAIWLCAAMLICAVGCGGSQKADNSASKEEAVTEEATPEADEPAESPASPAEEASPEEDLEESPVAETPDESPAAEIPEEAFASEAPGNATDDVNGEYDMQYAFVNLKNDGDSRIIIYPNGTVGDATVLYKEKTLSGLCDYIDETVLEEGRTINRPFLYDLVSVELVDPAMITDYNQFSMAMIYCLTIANEFYSIDVRVRDLVLDYNDIVKHTYDVTAEGKEDSWILDGHEKKFYLNGGNTEYTSSMFAPETMAVWSLVLDQYFEENS